MTAFGNILVCLDLTEMDEALIKYAGFLASIFKPAEITFIHVMESNEIPEEIADAFPDLGKPLSEIVDEEIKEKVEENLGQVNDVKVNVVLDNGLPTEQIIQYARKRRIDLAIIGKKIGYVGEGGVARRIVGLIPSSVLLVSETSPHQISKVLVRMDFSKTSLIALKTAKDISGVSGAGLECHHVYKLPLGYSPKNTPGEVKKLKSRLGQYVDNEFRAFMKKNKLDLDIPCSFSMDIQGDEAHMVYSHAIKTGADLIVSGSRIKSQLANVMLDSTSEKLAGANKSIPVLVVKDMKESIGFLKSLFDY